MQNFVTPHTHTQTLGHVNLSLFFFFSFFPFPNNFLPKMPSFNELQKLRSSESESKDHPPSSVYSYRKKKIMKKE